jgi:hypothetical protein
MIQWFKWEGGKAMPKNKDGLLLRYRETCTRVVAAVTYRVDEEELAAGVAVDVTSDDKGRPTNAAFEFWRSRYSLLD